MAEGASEPVTAHQPQRSENAAAEHQSACRGLRRWLASFRRPQAGICREKGQSAVNQPSLLHTFCNTPTFECLRRAVQERQVAAEATQCHLVYSSSAQVCICISCK